MLIILGNKVPLRELDAFRATPIFFFRSESIQFFMSPPTFLNKVSEATDSILPVTAIPVLLNTMPCQ